MAVRMYFGVLGPLLVMRDGKVLPLARPKERTLLVILLLNAGRVVTVDELAEGMWDSAPPPSAAVAIRNHVKRLRQALGDGARARISTGPNGYRIDVEPDELDVSQFEKLLAAAREAELGSMWTASARHARQALALWRGQPMGEAASDPAWARAVARLEEMRLQAIELAVGAELRLDRHAGLVPDLKRLVLEYPLRENLHALLMMALYGSGREAEALAAYQRARELLLDELGTEPGPALRDLFQRILTGNLSAPVLPAQEARGAAGSGVDVPRQLPAVPRHFTGRFTELAALARLLIPVAQPSRTAVIALIAGTAGVGKTALAVQWAQEAAESFPDGQLFVNLRGSDRDAPVPATDALAGFLRALGVGGKDIPDGEDERAARYRSLLAGKRTLIILDNASQASQVRPLLPGSAGCAVIITSRDSMAGLVAREGAERLDLDLLPLSDAVELLNALIGVRVTTAPAAAAQLAAGCARLPLALRVAGELATSRPDMPLAAIAAELLSHQHRLDLLDADGDPLTSVRSVISWSCQGLDDGPARMFGLLGLFPGPYVDAHAAAVLAGVPTQVAAPLLDQLSRVYLVEPYSVGSQGTGRFTMHDLLRAYAAELASADDPEVSRTALAQLLDYYFRTVSSAVTMLFPGHLRPEEEVIGAISDPAMTDPSVAAAWLDAQWENLVAAVERAEASGEHSRVIALVRPLFFYLESRGHYPVAVALCEKALRAGTATDSPAAMSDASSDLGILAWRQSRFQDATSQFERVLVFKAESGDEAGQASVFGNLGIVAFEQGDYEKATRYLRQARDLHRRFGRRAMEAKALVTLATISIHRGQYEQGISDLTEALAFFRETGSELNQAEILANLGSTALRMGSYREAAERLQEALAMLRECGYRHGEAHVLADLGVTALRQGESGPAAHHLRRALELFLELGERAGEAEARNGLGEMFFADGQTGPAREEHAAALGIATEIGNRFQVARAHHGLARTRAAAGDRAGTEQHLREAFRLYSDLGVPEADDVKAALATLSA
jgi:DNA-binding SARP family transcriptional activator/Tfp pilus assembly protein PilF